MFTRPGNQTSPNNTSAWSFPWVAGPKQRTSNRNLEQQLTQLGGRLLGKSPNLGRSLGKRGRRYRELRELRWTSFPGVPERPTLHWFLMVAGLEHEFYFPQELGWWSNLTNSYFSGGRSTSNSLRFLDIFCWMDLATTKLTGAKKAIPRPWISWTAPQWAVYPLLN